MQDFKQSAALFVSLRTPYLEPATVRSYKLALNSFQASAGNRDIQTYTGIDLLTFVQAQVQAKHKPNGINVYLRAIKAFGAWLVEQKILPHDNPFVAAKLLKVRRGDIRFLSQSEFAMIYQAEPNLQLRQIYLVALTCGQRLSDVVTLRWEQIDMTRGIIRFVAQKTNRRNSVPIHPMLAETLEKIGWQDQGPVFRSRRKKHLTASYVSHRFVKAARHAGIHDVSFHSLRRTFASWLAIDGVPMQQISKLLGHSSIMLTESHYASLAKSDLTPAIHRLHPATGSIQQLISGPEPDNRFQVHPEVKTLKM